MKQDFKRITLSILNQSIILCVKNKIWVLSCIKHARVRESCYQQMGASYSTTDVINMSLAICY